VVRRATAGRLVWKIEHRPLNPRTVAVLPFLNLSPDPDQDFFCDGIAEEILNTLTTVPQLNIMRVLLYSLRGFCCGRTH